jgi:hypothetical protein
MQSANFKVQSRHGKQHWILHQFAFYTLHFALVAAFWPHYAPLE